MEDTRTMNAHFLLDGSGDEVEREYLLEQIADTYEVWMLYVGSGFCPLKVAVEAHCEGDATCIFEEWARKSGRSSELGELVECEDCFKQMHWYTDGIWMCPECKHTQPEPENFGFYELKIQEVPDDVLSGAVTLQRCWPDTICVWNKAIPAPLRDDIGPDRLLKDVDAIDEIKGLLGIEKRDLLGDPSPVEEWVRWPVITDNERVKELLG